MTLDAKQKKYLIIGGAVILGVYLVSKWLHSMPKAENPDLQTPTLDEEKVLKKGRTCFIEGKLKNESWVDKDGNKKSLIKIRALQFQLVSTPSNVSSDINERTETGHDSHNDPNSY